nr:tripartite tricarboxylate transporter substrate binding protein [uncultured Roseateles sp.]
MKRRSFVISSLTGLAAGLSQAQTAGWPTGPVRLMVGFPPGGGTDVLARLLAQKLAAMWKATLVVDNKAGAAGTIAADQVAKSAPDGLNLLMAHISSHGIAPGLLPRLGYSAERDFTAIGLVGATPQMLICGAGQAVKTLPGLVELCRQKPGQISFGSAGNGSAQHLALELFKARAKVDVLHVPYKGSAPMITDMLGGQIQYAFEGMTTATTHLKSGRVIALAQTRPKRSKSQPGVPTLAEQGFDGFDASIWFGLVGPARLPPALVTRINADLNAVLAQPDVIEKLDQFGAEDGGGSPKRFGDFMSAERTKWAQIIKAGNVTPDS